MSHEEDFKKFSLYLQEIYGGSDEESLRLFEKDVRAYLIHRIKRTGGYGGYLQQALWNDLDDITKDVLVRFVRVYGKYVSRGGKIDSFTAMLNKVADLVFKEAIRRNIPKPSPDSLPGPKYDDLEILRACYKICLEKLSPDKKTLLLRYYPDDFYSKEELYRIHLKMALELSPELAKDPSPAEKDLKRAMIKLQKRVHDVKNNHLFIKCLQSCVKGKTPL
jgi:DNA-directed RNA polymerase specialized sigma24 family protein